MSEHQIGMGLLDQEWNAAIEEAAQVADRMDLRILAKRIRDLKRYDGEDG